MGPYNWTGFYIGAHIGGQFENQDWSNIIVPGHSNQTLPGTFSTSNASGFQGGLQGGYDWQMGWLVLGVEGDFSGSTLNGGQVCRGNLGDATATCELGMNWVGDLTGRVGGTWDRALFYLKGGGAVADSKFTPANESFGPGFSEPGYNTTDQTRWGWVVGAGVEYAIQDNWTVGAEYYYQDFGNRSVSFSPAGVDGCGGCGNPPFSANVSQHVHNIELLVNYRF